MAFAMFSGERLKIVMADNGNGTPYTATMLVVVDTNIVEEVRAESSKARELIEEAEVLVGRLASDKDSGKPAEKEFLENLKKRMEAFRKRLG